MSMSTNVVGIVPPDETWKKMKAVWDSCMEADIEVPDEVMKFFGYEAPDDKGVLQFLDGKECCTEWSDEGSSGFEIDIEKLPPHVRIIRFYNSW